MQYASVCKWSFTSTNQNIASYPTDMTLVIKRWSATHGEKSRQTKRCSQKQDSLVHGVPEMSMLSSLVACVLSAWLLIIGSLRRDVVSKDLFEPTASLGMPLWERQQRTKTPHPWMLQKIVDLEIRKFVTKERSDIYGFAISFSDLGPVWKV